MTRNRVELIESTARFIDPHTIELQSASGHGKRQISASKIVIACGTEAARDDHLPFDGQRVFTSDDVLSILGKNPLLVRMNENLQEALKERSVYL